MARQIFEMTTEDLQILMDACGPWSNAAGTRAAGIFAAWYRLSQKMGFDPMSVIPSGKGDRRFSAEPLPAKFEEAL